MLISEEAHQAILRFLNHWTSCPEPLDDPNREEEENDLLGDWYSRLEDLIEDLRKSYPLQSSSRSET